MCIFLCSKAREQLKKFITLEQDPRVSAHDNAELRSLEEQLRQNPDDEDAIDGLINRQEELFHAYRFVCAHWARMCDGIS